MKNPEFLWSNNHNENEAITVKVIIDLEEHCLNGTPHPVHDPGVVIYYLIKVNDQKHETKKSQMLGREIIALDSKDPEEYLIYQTRRKYGETYLEPIGKDELVNFKAEGIESFIVKPKMYHFSIGKKGYESNVRYLTVRQILVDFAHVDPTLNTLSTKGGSEYNNLEETIDLECVNKFVLFNNEPTPVS
ncbi:multiubiquitin domain-containing protein [Larkinella terrae]|uniref:Multi-ubiquitin domain-containing protein n=1 Tax=Larkinella terrae TaxID=2025311 RepID=A0A7K0EIF3_9BACT|nr:multiubiquitin domain-containing protein [Larkinella terrae]MRS61238.1 hypothetical protein [Larkinella terrae]